MIPVLAFFAGFLLGWLRAGNRGGNRLDRLQYGTAHGIAAALLGFGALIVAARFAGA
ncbi:MAG: hypothetical protein AAGE76_16850 [Pseudomonadota bacterium]